MIRRWLFQRKRVFSSRVVPRSIRMVLDEFSHENLALGLMGYPLFYGGDSESD